MLNKKGYFNINMIVLITIALMASFWLLTTPKVDIFKTVRDLPKLTTDKLATSNNNAQQNSQVSKKPVIDQNAMAKLSVKSINNSSDLNLIGKDLDSSNIDSLDNNINKIDVEVE